MVRTRLTPTPAGSLVRDKIMMKRTTSAGPSLSPHLIALRKAAQAAKGYASDVSIQVLRGNATQADKEAAWKACRAAAEAADAQLKIEMAAANAEGSA